MSTPSRLKMRLLLMSSSNVHAFGYFDQPEPFAREFLGERRRALSFEDPLDDLFRDSLMLAMLLSA